MTIRSPLLSTNPADIAQMADDCVEATWGLGPDEANPFFIKLREDLAAAYLAGALDMRRALSPDRPGELNARY
jgi:hypothetical protein